MRIFAISILLLSLLALFSPYLRRKTIIYRWQKALDLNKHLAHYQKLFADINGFELSHNARSVHDAIEYTYGEIEFISFIALLSLTKPNLSTVFYDLGSGVGKAVLACAMVFDVQKSCGIELLHPLHNTAVMQHRRLLQLPDYQAKANAIHLMHSDFLHADFSDATLVFINATAFFGESLHAINHRLKQIKKGTTVITTSKKLSSDDFIVIKITTVKMSWGLVKAFIQERI